MSNLRKELQGHLPYSIFCAAFGIVLSSLLMFIAGGMTKQVRVDDLKRLFHSFHPTHLLLSATATTAMFYHYEQRFLKAVLTGFIGATLFCSLSDIVLPAIGSLLFGSELHLHICLIKHPAVVLPFVVIGALIGCGAAKTIEKSTVYSHSGHVLVSTMASLFYLLTFCPEGQWLGSGHIGATFILVSVAVVLPCCLSDIVFPVLIAEADREQHDREHPHC